MTEIMTKKEAVEIYGSAKAKAHFEKYKCFKEKTMESSLIKTLEQHYESVEVVKQGRSNVYQLGSKLSETKQREDGRIFNGENTRLKYTNNIDIIVISGLAQKMVSESAQTMRKWLFEFGLINNNLFDLMGAKPSNNKETVHMTYLSDSGILGEDQRGVLRDFKMYTKDLQGQLQRSLIRLKKAGIIELYEVKKARVIVERESGRKDYDVVNLHEITWARITEKRKELMLKHGVTGFEIDYLHNKPSVKAFNKEFVNYLRNDVIQITGNDTMEHLVVANFWTAWAINIKCTDNKMIKYLQKFNRNAEMTEFLKNEESFVNSNKYEYIEERFKHVVDKAGTKHKNAVAKHEEEAVKKEIANREMMEVINDIFGDDIFLDEDYDDVNEEAVKYNDILMDSLYIERIAGLQKFYGDIFSEVKMTS